MLSISNTIAIPLSEIEITAIRAQGAGGQNVNKVSSAVHLRFDIRASSLPDSYKQRLLHRKDRRISQSGVIVIKAQRLRSQEQNRADALRRLQEILRAAAVIRRRRRPSLPSLNSRQKRLDSKTRRGRLKALRRKVGWKDEKLS